MICQILIMNLNIRTLKTFSIPPWRDKNITYQIKYYFTQRNPMPMPAKEGSESRYTEYIPASDPFPQ